MSFSNIQIANMALAEVGKYRLTAALAELSQVNLTNLFTQTRDELLEEHHWKFSLRRRVLTAAGILDCSSKTITIADADPDTITDSGSGFVSAGFIAGERVQIEGSGSNNTAFNLDTVAAGTLTLDSNEEVTAETLTNDSDLKLYASPAYNWAYKYPKPSDCLQVIRMNEIIYEDQEDPSWDIEGDYLVTDELDENDQVKILYISQVTDTTKWNPLFVKAFYLTLASKLAIPLANDKKLKDSLKEDTDKAISLAKKRNAIKGKTNLKRKDTSWQKAVS